MQCFSLPQATKSKFSAIKSGWVTCVRPQSISIPESGMWVLMRSGSFGSLRTVARAELPPTQRPTPDSRQQVPLRLRT